MTIREIWISIIATCLLGLAGYMYHMETKERIRISKTNEITKDKYEKALVIIDSLKNRSPLYSAPIVLKGKSKTITLVDSSKIMNLEDSLCRLSDLFAVCGYTRNYTDSIISKDLKAYFQISVNGKLNKFGYIYAVAPKTIESRKTDTLIIENCKKGSLYIMGGIPILLTTPGLSVGAYYTKDKLGFGASLLVKDGIKPVYQAHFLYKLK